MSTVATSRLWLTLTITATILYVLYTQVAAMDVVAAMAVAEVQLAATTMWRRNKDFSR